MAEPVTFEMAQAHLRLGEDTSDQEYIESLIAAARLWVENHTGHILVRRTFTEQRDRFTSFLEITKRPLIEVTSIGYTDEAGAEQTYADFVALSSYYPARVFPAHDASWPAVRGNMPVTVSYVAGYTEGEVPETLVHAVLLLVGHYYANREAGAERPVTDIPLGVESLCAPYRPLVG